MVEIGVGEQNRADGDTTLGDQRQHRLRGQVGVDHDRVAGVQVLHQVGVGAHLRIGGGVDAHVAVGPDMHRFMVRHRLDWRRR